MQWQKILSEGHVWTGRLNDPAGRRPVFPFLRTVPALAVSLIVFGPFVAGGVTAVGAMLTASAFGGDATPAAAPVAKPQNDGSQALGQMAQRMYAPQAGPDGAPLAPKISVDDLKGLLPNLIQAAKDGQLKTTWTGGPLPVDDVVAIVADDGVIWLFARVLDRGVAQPFVGTLRKTDGDWKAFTMQTQRLGVVISGTEAKQLDEVPNSRAALGVAGTKVMESAK
jgi:hypothetical protein